MIAKDISRRVVTVGPDPDARGGIAQVLRSYYDGVFPEPRYIVEARPGGKLSKLVQFGRSMFQLWDMLRRDPDIRVVHLHTAAAVSFPRSAWYLRLARRMGRRTVLHMHSGKFPAYYDAHRKSAQRTLEQADLVVALSPRWEQYYRGLGLERVAVVPNIVDDPKTQSDASDGPVHALFLGLFDRNKGIFDLIEAIGRRQSELRGRLVVHLGGHGQDELVARQIESLGVGDIVKVEGWVAGARKAELLARSELFVLPSYFEGVPISILEAMSYGAAIVASNVGGIPEIVDERNGLLSDPGDVDALADNLVKVTTDGSLRRRLGQGSLERVQAHRPQAVASVLESIYRKLI